MVAERAQSEGLKAASIRCSEPDLPAAVLLAAVPLCL